MPRGSRITMTAECIGDAKGERRIRKLQDSVLNLQMQVLEKLDCIAVMEHEIKVMREISEGER